MTTLADAREMDAADPFAQLRPAFELAEHSIYLDGHSLGPRSRLSSYRVSEAVERQWRRDLVAGWNKHDWIGLPQRLGARIAPLIGAQPHEVVVTDSVSVNLFKLIAAALAARPGRNTVLTEPGNFPTDLYVAQGVTNMVPGACVKTVPADRIVDAIDADTALVMLTHVHYKSAAKLDMAAITVAAQAQGALMLWDLSHSTGAVAVDLNGCNADLAVGCGYKYLNGGPGAPAFLFVAERLHNELVSPLSGWMGHADAFAFDDAYRPAPGIARFLCGTPPIVAMAALEGGLEAFGGVDMAALATKAGALGDLLIARMEPLCAGYGFALASPREAAVRGAHISYAHPDAWPICRALIADDVTGDFRAPDVLRFGLAPLYTRFEDVWTAVERLTAIMDGRRWDTPVHRRSATVT